MRRLDVSELRRALLASEFGVLYQPQFDWTGATRGYEALVRWNHPRLGAVPPADFLRTMEDEGLLDALTERVVATVCEDARVLRAGPGRPVWINVSPRQLLDPGLGDAILGAMQLARLPQGTLGVDVGASSGAAPADALARAVAELRVRGLLVTLGHDEGMTAAIGEVDAIAVDVSRALRPDGSLPADAKLHAPFDVADALGATLVAQRVESRQHADAMLEIGCDILQGYWFARPRPLDAVSPARLFSERVEADAQALFVG